MATDKPATSPEQVFQTNRVLHMTFVAAVFVYIAVAEIIRWGDSEFAERGGFVALGDEIWLVRGILVVVSGIQLVLTHTLYGDAFVRNTIRRSKDVTDETVIVSLQSTFIVRLALAESVAIYGLVLYMMNGERLDLYAFCAAALLNLLFIRPQRSEWEAIFREAAIEYPGVRSSPW
jgi:hypothetical protein